MRRLMVVPASMIRQPRCPPCNMNLMTLEGYREACRAGVAKFSCRRCGAGLIYALKGGAWVYHDPEAERRGQAIEAERARVSAEHAAWEIGPGWVIRTCDNADGVEREYRYAGTDQDGVLHLFRADDGDEQVMFWSRVSGDWTTVPREEYDRRHPGLPELRWSEES